MHCPKPSDIAPKQLSVPGVPGRGAFYVPSGGLGHGNIRGVAVCFHGLIAGTVPPTFPLSMTDSGGILPTNWGTLKTDLLAQNYVVLYPSLADDGSTEVPAKALFDDIGSDEASGGRYLATNMLHADHIRDWCRGLLNSNFHTPIDFRTPVPMVAIGFSLGGWTALQMVTGRLGTWTAYAVRSPATILSNASPTFTTPANYSSLDTSGFDLGPHALDGVGIPGQVSYGTTDSAVGWQKPGGALPTSNIDAMITNGQAAGQTITRKSNALNHEMGSTDVTDIMSFITGTANGLCPPTY